MKPDSLSLCLDRTEYRTLEVLLSWPAYRARLALIREWLDYGHLQEARR